MEDLINDSIIESISENYQIYKMTCESIPTKYVIRDENGELVRHNNMTFFPSLKDAETAIILPFPEITTPPWGWPK